MYFYLPRGAGIRRTRTDPHLPDTLQGTVWGAPELAPQYPRRTGTKFILALMIPPSICVYFVYVDICIIEDKYMYECLCMFCVRRYVEMYVDVTRYEYIRMY